MKVIKHVDYNNISSIVILIRLIVGTIFLSEGLQKFLFPAARGVGRFVKIGLPSPEFLSYFVASFEVFCGILILLGLATRLASIPLMTIMLVAIITTKIPILLNMGFWEMAHAARTDFALLLGSLFLFLSGGGNWSLEKRFPGKLKNLFKKRLLHQF